MRIDWSPKTIVAWDIHCRVGRRKKLPRRGRETAHQTNTARQCFGATLWIQMPLHHTDNFLFFGKESAAFPYIWNTMAIMVPLRQETPWIIRTSELYLAEIMREKLLELTRRKNCLNIHIVIYKTPLRPYHECAMLKRWCHDSSGSHQNSHVKPLVFQAWTGSEKSSHSRVLQPVLRIHRITFAAWKEDQMKPLVCSPQGLQRTTKWLLCALFTLQLHFFFIFMG